MILELAREMLWDNRPSDWGVDEGLATREGSESQEMHAADLNIAYDINMPTMERQGKSMSTVNECLSATFPWVLASILP